MEEDKVNEVGTENYKDKIDAMNRACDELSFKPDVSDEDNANNLESEVEAILENARKENVPDEYLQRPKNILEICKELKDVIQKGTLYYVLSTMDIKVLEINYQLNNIGKSEDLRYLDYDEKNRVIEERINSIIKDLNLVELEDISLLSPEFPASSIVRNTIEQKKYYMIHGEEFNEEEYYKIPDEEKAFYLNIYNEVSNMSEEERKLTFKRAHFIERLSIAYRYNEMSNDIKNIDEFVERFYKNEKEDVFFGSIHNQFDKYVKENNIKKEEFIHKIKYKKNESSSFEKKSDTLLMDLDSLFNDIYDEDERNNNEQANAEGQNEE